MFRQEMRDVILTQQERRNLHDYCQNLIWNDPSASQDKAIYDLTFGWKQVEDWAKSQAVWLRCTLCKTVLFLHGS